MYRKVGKDQTKQQKRVKKNIGCHGEKERMEERNGLDKLTLCKMLPWFTFVNVQEIGWKNTRAATARYDLSSMKRVKYVKGEG